MFLHIIDVKISYSGKHCLSCLVVHICRPGNTFHTNGPGADNFPLTTFLFFTFLMGSIKGFNQVVSHCLPDPYAVDHSIGSSTFEVDFSIPEENKRVLPLINSSARNRWSVSGGIAYTVNHLVNLHNWSLLMIKLVTPTLLMSSKNPYLPVCQIYLFDVHVLWWGSRIWFARF